MAQDLLFVMGSPRSGTTWLAKIIDSHPGVSYRHEPDSVLRAPEIPAYCEDDAIECHMAAASAYLDRLVQVRTSKVLGSRPIFPKTYRSALSHGVFAGAILVAKAGERFSITSRFFRKLRISERMRADAAPELLVVKSISALGRLGLFWRCRPDAKTILIVRHPCGHVASVLEGIARRRFDTRVPATEDIGIYEDLARTTQARRRSLDLAAFKAMPAIERLAWIWAISNEKAMEDLDDARGRIVRYEDLCEDPAGVARALFEFCLLDWTAETARYVHDSTSRNGGGEDYYDLVRNPLQAANKWRTQLAPDDIARILGAVGDTKPGRLFAGPAA